MIHHLAEIGRELLYRLADRGERLILCGVLGYHRFDYRLSCRRCGHLADR